MAPTVIGYIAFSQLIQHFCEAILRYFHVGLNKFYCNTNEKG